MEMMRPQSDGGDGAAKHDVLSTKLRPKGDEAAEICQNSGELCVRSSAPATGMVRGPALGGDGQGTSRTQLGPALGRCPQLAPATLGEERAMEDAAPMGWSPQPSRPTSRRQSRRVTREGNTGKQERSRRRAEAGEGI